MSFAANLDQRCAASAAVTAGQSVVDPRPTARARPEPGWLSAVRMTSEPSTHFSCRSPTAFEVLVIGNGKWSHTHSASAAVLYSPAGHGGWTASRGAHGNALASICQARLRSCKPAPITQPLEDSPTGQARRLVGAAPDPSNLESWWVDDKGLRRTQRVKSKRLPAERAALRLELSAVGVCPVDARMSDRVMPISRQFAWFAD